MSHPGLANLADVAAKPLELAIVLPTLNERGNLAPLVARLDEALAGIAWEAIFVDDNSPDGTSDEARKLSQSDRRIRVIQRIGRRGLASAAIEGMMATAAPVVAVMDADHQHDPRLLPGMLKEVASGDYDLAVAPALPKGRAPRNGAARTGSKLPTLQMPLPAR